jgi:hypothetical protein
VLDFKGRRRDVWGRFYTELFFLDELTALAAGHRPCFECRRKDAQLFAEKWGEVHQYRKPPYAAEMDNVLHADCSWATAAGVFIPTRRPRRRIHCIRWSGLRRSWRHAPTLDAGWLRCSPVAAAPDRHRRAHPAIDNRNPVSWLRTTLAPERNGLAFVVRKALE